MSIERAHWDQWLSGSIDEAQALIQMPARCSARRSIDGTVLVPRKFAASRSSEGLAFVLMHEIGHFAYSHVASKRAARWTAAALIAIAAAKTPKPKTPVGRKVKAATVAAGLGLAFFRAPMALSPAQELEADAFALRAAKAAGFKDSRGVAIEELRELRPSGWTVMNVLGASVHPEPSERISAIKALSSKLMSASSTR